MSKLPDEWVEITRYFPARDDGKGEEVVTTVEKESEVNIGNAGKSPERHNLVDIEFTETSENEDGEQYISSISVSADVIEEMYRVLHPESVSDIESRLSDEVDDRVVEFCKLIEEKTGQRVSFVDPFLGGLGWMGIEISFKLQGKEFEGELTLDILEDSVNILFAEIECDHPLDERREEILEDVATMEDWREDEYALYEYHPSELEVAGLMKQLKESHSQAF